MKICRTLVQLHFYPKNPIRLLITKRGFGVKQWVKKLADQFSDLEWQKSQETKAKPGKKSSETGELDLNEERATLLFFIDLYSKHLFEIEKHPIRQVRKKLDEFAQELLQPQSESTEKLYFQIRQFFSTYRIDEHSYIEKSFNDFKNIVWDFADQLSEDIEAEKVADADVLQTLDQLRNAIESNSIEGLRSTAKSFITKYHETQVKKESRRTKRVQHLQKNLKVVKKELTDAHSAIRTDHLTGAFNRKAFDEEIRKHYKFYEATGTGSCVAILDIDFFKKINDTYGHDIGDYVLKEFVRILHEVFTEDGLFIARTGGEEFAVIFPEWAAAKAFQKIEEAHHKIRKEVFIHEDKQIKFTISAGLAELAKADSLDGWIKKADSALYFSKQNGRNQTTLSGTETKLKIVAS